MEKMYPLVFLHYTSVRRAIEWGLSKFISGVSFGKLGTNKAYPASRGRDVFGLHPRLVRAKYPTGETPHLAATFINQFLKVRGDLPPTSVRSGGSTLPTSHGGTR